MLGKRGHGSLRNYIVVGQELPENFSRKRCLKFFISLRHVGVTTIICRNSLACNGGFIELNGPLQSGGSEQEQGVVNSASTACVYEQKTGFADSYQTVLLFSGNMFVHMGCLQWHASGRSVGCGFVRTNFCFRQPWFDRDHGFGGLSGDLSVALR